MPNPIKKILMSEKSFQAVANSKYSFIVQKNIDKNSFAKLCENLFNINTISVNSMNYKGKEKLTKRVKGRRANFKKIILTLKKGQKIDLFEVETQEEKPTSQNKIKKEKIVNKKTESDVEVKIKTKK